MLQEPLYLAVPPDQKETVLKEGYECSTRENVSCAGSRAAVISAFCRHNAKPHFAILMIVSLPRGVKVEKHEGGVYTIHTHYLPPRCLKEDDGVGSFIVLENSYLDSVRTNGLYNSGGTIYSWATRETGLSAVMMKFGHSSFSVVQIKQLPPNTRVLTEGLESQPYKKEQFKICLKHLKPSWLEVVSKPQQMLRELLPPTRYKHFLLPLRALSFTQDTCSDSFTDGKPLSRTINELIDKPANVHNIKPIIVVWFKDNWWSQDNRRLAAFCLAGLTEIPVQIGTVTYKFVDHKSTKPYQDGRSIRITGINKVVNIDSNLGSVSSRQHLHQLACQDGRSIRLVVNNEPDDTNCLQVFLVAIICVAAFVHWSLTSLG